MHSKLDFAYWKKYYARLHYGDSNAELVAAYVHAQACDMHALSVFNPLRDLISASVFSVVPRLTNESAKYYMQFGAARRFRMIWGAYRTIIYTAKAEREVPLDSDETQELTEALNLLYVNLRGVLDNLAWCVAHENPEKMGFDLEDKKSRSKIGFYLKAFAKNSEFYDLSRDIAEHEEWYFAVAKKRDPSAHRIPLAIPPAIVTDEEAEERISLQEAALNAASKLEFDKSEAAHKRIDQLGSFFPVFVHHPNEDSVPIYPTIPTDMAHLISISEKVFGYLMGEKNFEIRLH